jgi:hypothetical protein
MMSRLLLVAGKWLALGLMVACTDRGAAGGSPMYLDAPDAPSSPKCAFVPLRSDTVDPFLCWIGQIPASPPDPRLEPAIDAARGDKKTLQALLARLDYGSMSGEGDIVLLVIPQLQDADALAPLERFIWLPPMDSGVTQDPGLGGPTDLEILQGNACRSLLCIGSQEAQASYDNVINNHPDWNVKAFALKTGNLETLSGPALSAACRFYKGV